MFHYISNTENKVENTMRFKLFEIVIKHCIECLMQLPQRTNSEGEIRDAKTSRVSSNFQTRCLISFVLALCIIHEFEKIT